MADYVPVFAPGQDISLTTSAAVTGGQLLVISGNDTVAASSAASAAWVGVAAFDAASGAKVTVHSGGVHELLLAADAAAGVNVVAGAAGAVTPYVGGTHTVDQIVGLVVRGALAAAKARVKLAR